MKTPERDTRRVFREAMKRKYGRSKRTRDHNPWRGRCYCGHPSCPISPIPYTWVEGKSTC